MVQQLQVSWCEGLWCPRRVGSLGAGWAVTDATSVEVGRRTGRLPSLAPQAYYRLESDDHLAEWPCDHERKRRYRHGEACKGEKLGKTVQKHKKML